MGTPRKPPTVDIAIEECKKFGVNYDWKWGANSHVKFYIIGSPKIILLSQGNKANFEHIARHIRREVKQVIEEMRR